MSQIRAILWLHAELLLLGVRGIIWWNDTFLKISPAEQMDKTILNLSADAENVDESVVIIIIDDEFTSDESSEDESLISTFW